MIIGTGLDMVRVKALEYDFMIATFTENERHYCDSEGGGLPRWQRYATFLAAKEAFKKALGGAFLDIPYLDLEVSMDEHMRPSITLCCPEKYGHGHASYTIHVSFTRALDHAVAMVAIEEHGNTWFNKLFGSKNKG